MQEETGRSGINCEACDGSGYVYADPIAIQAHIAQFEKSTKIYEKFGMWLDGKCSITVVPEHRLGFRDSLEMRDSVMNFSEVLQKGDRKGIRSKLPDGVDSARYRILSMTRIIVMSGSSPVYLEEEIDFRITEDGWIEWLNSRVASGESYSVRYEFHPVWVVGHYPHSTRDDTSGKKTERGVDNIVSLPLQCAAYLDFLLDANNRNGRMAPVTGSLIS